MAHPVVHMWCAFGIRRLIKWMCNSLHIELWP